MNDTKPTPLAIWPEPAPLHLVSSSCPMIFLPGASHPAAIDRLVDGPAGELEGLLAQLEDAVGQVRRHGALADQEVEVDRHAGRYFHVGAVARQRGAVGAHHDAVGERAGLRIDHGVGVDLLDLP